MATHLRAEVMAMPRMQLLTTASATSSDWGAAVQAGRGDGALRKIGAVQEGILRKSFLRDGKHLDQALWSIIAQDWYRSKAVWGSRSAETVN